MASAAPNPYDLLPHTMRFELGSDDVSDGERLPITHASGVMGAGGDDLSPHLSWSGHPSATATFVVTCFDIDAPTGSGFWHWMVCDIPASVTTLPTDAGSAAAFGMPAGARTISNDAGTRRYLGAAPPAAHGPHRYLFAVHALDLASLPVDDDASPALSAFNMFDHTIGRATLTTTFER